MDDLDLRYLHGLSYTLFSLTKNNLRSSGGHGRSAVTSRGGGGAGADVFERSQSVEGDTYVHRTDMTLTKNVRSHATSTCT